MLVSTLIQVAGVAGGFGAAVGVLVTLWAFRSPGVRALVRKRAEAFDDDEDS